MYISFQFTSFTGLLGKKKKCLLFFVEISYFNIFQDHLALMMELLGMMPRKVRNLYTPALKLITEFLRY